MMSIAKRIGINIYKGDITPCYQICNMYGGQAVATTVFTTYCVSIGSC